MEELARTPDTNMESDGFKRARFALYTIEKDLISGLLRKEKKDRIMGLYVIIDAAFLGSRSHTEVAVAAIRGGATVIQLRDKEHGKKQVLAAAEELKKISLENGVLFIVNDDLDVALAVDADGLHVGQDDLPAEAARNLLPVDKVLGVSARTMEEAQAAAGAGADYLGVGAIYSTSSKDDAVVTGPERISEIHHAIDLPIVAIGGINKGNIKEVVIAGACSAAVISAVLSTEDVEKAARELSELFKEVQSG
jgi:thiamine-phosphate pyrophosphorylase